MKNEHIFLCIPLCIVLLAVSCPAYNENPGNPFEDMFPGEIRDISAVTLVQDMGIGVNIGNTFDSLSADSIIGETGWGNPKVSRDYVRALKEYGYKSVRLPVSWVDYMGPAPNYTIKASWINRVSEVVSWILAEDMYCILNIHHDGGDPPSNRPESPKFWIKKASVDEERVNQRLAAVWKQIAAHFANASDKLILEAMNEVGFDDLWNRWGGTSGKTEAYRILNRLNQTFVDSVRSVGGNNAARYLLVSGYWTDINDSCDPLFKMPEDTAEDRLILSVHYYTPSTFCIADSPNTSWGFRDNWGAPETLAADTAELNGQFNKLKNSFTGKGVPVIVGEYGATRSNKVREGRIRWMTAVTQICLDNGICPVLWETGGEIRRTAPFTMSEPLAAVWENIRFVQ